MSGNRIFISYRREDGAAQAGRLADRLVARFGDARVFMDVDDISPGEDFTHALDTRLADCALLLAVIGPRWLALRGGDGARRIDNVQDYVRLEIATALADRKRVIPVLVGGAAMPAEADLPDALKPLARCQAVSLRDAEFPRDVDGLIAAIEPGRAQLRRWLGFGAAAVIAVLATLQLAKRPPPAPDPLAATAHAVEGRWRASVTYSWGATHEEAFDLQVIGGDLGGSAGFLGLPRAIVEGRVLPGGIVFATRTQSIEGGGTATLTHRYRGTPEGETIRFQLATEGGVARRDPVEFVARRDIPRP